MVLEREREVGYRGGEREKAQFVESRGIRRNAPRLALLLVGSKNEKLIPDDLSTHRAARIITMKQRLWEALLDAEKVVLVETAVLEKAEQATMVLVRAGLRDHVYYTSHGPAGFRRVAVDHHIELLNPFHCEVLNKAAYHIVLVVAAVHIVVK